MSSIRSICVYCGSSNAGPSSHRAAAVRLGHLMAESGIQLVFGGGRVGLMGAIADAVMERGGRALGVIPEHLVRAEVGHAQVSELIVVANMHTRKETMFARADAFVVLPGGPGTLDELFEILTWRQLRLHGKPIVIVNLDGYWDALAAMVDTMVATRYVAGNFRDLFTVVTDVGEVIPALRSAAEPAVPAQLGRL